MFGGSLFMDPFFGDIGSQMREMQSMHEQMMQGMMGFRSAPYMQPAIDYQPQPAAQQQLVARRDPFGFPGGLFGGGIFNQMNSMMSMNGAGGLMAGRWDGNGDPNSQFYSSSTVMSISNTGAGGQPKVYQASTSTRHTPEGVREMRRMERDSSTGVEKVHHGRHIGERGHVVQRQRNIRTGDREENVEFVNLDEEEAPQFDQEWKTKAPTAWQRSSNQKRAVADARSRYGGDSSRRHTTTPAIEYKER